MIKLEQFVKKKLDEISENKLLRNRESFAGSQDVIIKIKNQQLLNFSSNNYLGLANHPTVIESVHSVLNKVGIGSGASHVVVGHHELHTLAENALAKFLGYERCLLFSTGFMANIGVISSLLTAKDHLFQDKLNHSSLIQAGMMTGAKCRRYPHVNTNILKTWLQKNSESLAITSNTLVATDSVFSMDGDIAPIPELMTITKENNVWLMIDDAHGFGVLGKNGRGSLSHFNLLNKKYEMPIYIATLSKALGVAGAVVAGSNEIIEYIMQTAKSYIYTTAMPPILAQAIISALGVMQTEPWRQAKLHENISYFNYLMNKTDITFQPSITAIQTIILYDEKKTVNISALLRERKLLVKPIRTPSVPKGKARLRITLSANHSKSNIEALIKNLKEIIHV